MGRAACLGRGLGVFGADAGDGAYGALKGAGWKPGGVGERRKASWSFYGRVIFC